MADFTIADVLAWARTKPVDESYYYGSNNDCAICQFLRETGRCLNPAAGGDYWRDRAIDGWAINPFPAGLPIALQAGTFGSLVARLQGLCPEMPITQSNWAAIDAYLTDIDAVSADKLAPAHIQPHTV